MTTKAKGTEPTAPPVGGNRQQTVPDPLASERGGSLTDRQLVDRGSIKSGHTSSTHSRKSSLLKGSVLSTNSARGLTGSNRIQKRSQHQTPSLLHRLLQSIDIYPMPIRVHVQNQYTQPTFCGGVLSVITYLVLLLLVTIKGYSLLVEHGHDTVSLRRLQGINGSPTEDPDPLHRFLQVTPDADAANGTNGTSNNTTEEKARMNFDFWTYSEEDFNASHYGDQPLSLKDNGIERVTMTLNLHSFFDQYDADMMEVMGAFSQITLDDVKKQDLQKHFIGDPQFDQALVAEINNYFKRKPYGDLSRFYSIRWNETMRDQRSDTEEEPREAEDTDLKYISFEVEVKTMAGKNEQSKRERMVFSSDKFDWSVPYRPTLDITDHIKVMGDFFSDSENDVRTVTSVRMVMDYEKIVQIVYKRTVEYLEEFINNPKKYVVEVEKCGEFEEYAEQPAFYTESERQQMAVELAAEQAEKLLDFSQEFTVFDEEYFRKAEALKDQIEDDKTADWQEEIDDYIKDYYERHTNRDYPEYPTRWLDEFNTTMDLCYNITQKFTCQTFEKAAVDKEALRKRTSEEIREDQAAFDPTTDREDTEREKGCAEAFAYLELEKKTAVYTRFRDLFKNRLNKKFKEIESQFKEQSVFDSVQLQITRKDAQYPELVIQDAHHKKNFECFINAVKQTEGEYGEFCEKYENIVYMKLTDYSMQDINVLTGRGLEIEKAVPETIYSKACAQKKFQDFWSQQQDECIVNSTMKVSRQIQAVRHQRVGRELVRDYPAVDYETLWQVSFALENRITHARHIWFVQDDEEARGAGSRRRRLQASDSEGETAKSASTSKDSNRSNKDGGLRAFVIAMLDMCAFVGGAWFVLTRVVFGPLSQMAEHNLYVADLDQKVVLKEYTGELAPGQRKDADAGNLESADLN